MNSTTLLGSLFRTKDDDRAVSPVIGVILMVAITVILAATVGAFLFGFGDESEEEVQAGVTVSGQNSDNATVTWTSKGTATSITFSDDADVTGDDVLDVVGESTTINTSGSGTFSVIAVNDDSGAETVIRVVSY